MFKKPIEKLSEMMEEYYAELEKFASNQERVDIGEDGSKFDMNYDMIDARAQVSHAGLVEHLNDILVLQCNMMECVVLECPDISRDIYYVMSKYIMKVNVCIRRLWLSFGVSFFLFNMALSLSLYPVMALLLMHGLGANDLFLGICFTVFFPFMYVTVTCAASMAEVYRVLLLDVEDGIYSVSALQASFMIFFLFSALNVCVTTLASILVVRPETYFEELFSALMVLNLDMMFFIGLIYSCVVASAGDPSLVRYLLHYTPFPMILFLKLLPSAPLARYNVVPLVIFCRFFVTLQSS
jgi:hypothetical protein